MEKFISLAFHLLLASLVMFQPAICSSNFTDQDALLRFQSAIEVNPMNTIKGGNWTAEANFCEWIGVVCSNRRQRVMALDLSHDITLAKANLTGSIPPTLFNGSLTDVDFMYNNLSGSLPSDLCSRWPNIRRLLLSYNEFSGMLPETLTQCKELLVLSLSHNRFQGSIPRDMDSLQKLQELYLGSNNLTGMIPRTISNMSSLRMLYVGINHIEGDIPSEIGKLVNLNEMSLQNNLLTGEVPEEVFNISSLQVLSLRGNSLSGSLLPSSELSLPNLEILILSDNGFGGNFLQYISNFSSLIRFDAGKNQLSGPIPTSLGNLKNLRLFAVASNQLTGETDGSELGFISALSNCQSLEILILEDNPLRGSIPESIRNLSSSLQFLFAPYCQIRGHIPGEMGFLKSLTFLELSDNDIVGNIPSSIGGLESLQRLHLDNNHLEGPIPNEICNFTSLGELLLRQNRISGSIPNCIGNLSRLQKFTLSSNNMTSVIPVSPWNLEELIFLNLSLNSFNGGLPLDMGKMRAINSIDLSWNRLTGAISSSIQELKSLSSLNLSRNSFQGSIPQAIGNLKGLDFLDLSYNELSGAIPKSMEGLTYLQNLNLSFNKLPGEIPNGGPFANFSALSFIGNEALCGNAAFQVPPCKENGKKSSRDMPLRYYTLWFQLKHQNTGKKAPVSVENPPRIEHPMISYRELCSATNNFSESNLLEAGCFSSVCKGTLVIGTDIAIKVLNLHIEGAIKSFDAECEVFCKIKHRNLVKVISTCTNTNLRALVLQYVPHGSLEKWLYSNNYNLGLHQ
ncbi:receptor kinase-like protein Xa21 [Syzygium oleosum]|uniref:receptor kinase-like protein Xa21 n=1 Tax=Syzygium oleosum TaxID=219896 RepID=UPI0024BAE429|nr:receptor kinase-like protein Xa21 [Syzygium oleosum]